jgi:hypothetical protein
MRLLSTPLALTIVATSLAFAFVGCVDALPPGAVLASAPPAAPGPSEASVTFVRPESACDTGEYTVIVDDHGRFAADVAAGTQVTVPVVPGAHAFYAWSHVDVHVNIERAYNPVAATRVNAVAGRATYVSLEVESPCRSNRATFEMHQFAAAAAADKELEHWLGNTRAVTVDRAAGQARLEENPAHLAWRLELGQQRLRRVDEAEAAGARHAALQLEDSSEN